MGHHYHKAWTSSAVTHAEGTNVNRKGTGQHEGSSIRTNNTSLTSIWPVFIIPLFETSLSPTLQLYLDPVEPSDPSDDHCGELNEKRSEIGSPTCHGAGGWWEFSMEVASSSRCGVEWFSS
ncbi:hypothetical protein FRB94_002862 [Tulasnella sp. JGI-2019a]|nr:hypothetical protein FRB93_001984 [Tulasnella sp. JGI-2019a]KAG8986364.1 hypothetical protein FRB94_002862 [Tulasnella sp. JGI-2019a]KAG9021337.1 hypothetical protein FRB95_002344 [Tulasnella sp. JGI-2019a]